MMISLVSFTEVSFGFFNFKSLKSLDFLAVLSSSFKLFLNGTFFNLMVPYSIRSKSVKVNGEVYQKFSNDFKRLGP